MSVVELPIVWVPFVFVFPSTILLPTILVPDFSAVNLRYSGWIVEDDAVAAISMLIHHSCSCCHARYVLILKCYAVCISFIS